MKIISNKAKAKPFRKLLADKNEAYDSASKTRVSLEVSSI